MSNKEKAQQKLILKLSKTWEQVCNNNSVFMTCSIKGSSPKLNNDIDSIWEVKDKLGWKWIHYKQKDGKELIWERLSTHDTQDVYFASARSLITL
jgi:hypothetical protein